MAIEEGEGLSETNGKRRTFMTPDLLCGIFIVSEFPNDISKPLFRVCKQIVQIVSPLFC